MGLCEGNIFPIFLFDGLFLPLFRGLWLYYILYKLPDVSFENKLASDCVGQL